MATERSGNGHREVSPDQILASVDFAEEKGLMKVFVLKGPVGEASRTHLAILLRERPENGQSELITLLGEGDEFTGINIDAELSSLEVPFSLRNGDGPSRDKEEFLRASRILAEANTPFIMLEMGESERTEQEMAVIHVVNGITLETAIASLRIASQK